MPAHPIGIWLGAYKPRMLAIIGRLADGWVPSFGYVKAPDLAEANARIDEAARAPDRDPASIRRVLNVAGYVTDGPVNGPFEGPVDHLVETFASLTLEYGMDSYLIGDVAQDLPDQFRRFAGEVAPRVREVVAKARGRPES